MAYPFDYFLTCASANNRLAAKLTEAVRENYMDIVRTGQKLLTDIGGQARSLSSPADAAESDARNEAFSALWADIEKSREASLLRIREALEEWQLACQQATTQVLEQAGEAASAATNAHLKQDKPEADKAAARAASGKTASGGASAPDRG